MYPQFILDCCFLLNSLIGKSFLDTCVIGTNSYLDNASFVPRGKSQRKSQVNYDFVKFYAPLTTKMVTKIVLKSHLSIKK